MEIKNEDEENVVFASVYLFLINFCIQSKETIKFKDMDYDKKNSDYNRLKNYTFIRNENEES